MESHFGPRKNKENLSFQARFWYLTNTGPDFGIKYSPKPVKASKAQEALTKEKKALFTGMFSYFNGKIIDEDDV